MCILKRHNPFPGLGFIEVFGHPMLRRARIIGRIYGEVSL
jgi:hypothetical protein